MEHSYILSILYEMALVIGGEVSVKPLLNKMLQRLLYHTSFPTGFVCLGVPSGAADSTGMIEVRIDAAVGDYELAGLVGQTVRLPAQLLLGAAERGEDAALLAALPDKNSRYKAFLRLPIEGQGVIVLLAPQLPDTDLPLTQLFQPLMASLSRAIVLCRNYDAYTGGLIAARDASQQALTASEEKFRAISSVLLDALIMVDDSGVLVYWNPAAERILGYRADEVLGSSLHQLLIPQRYQNRAAEGLNAFRGTGQGTLIGKTIEIEALHKDGHEIPVELSISALKLNGRWHAVGLLRDITEKKRLEEELRQANVYNRSLIEASLDPLVTISAEGKITDVNRTTEAVTGRSRSELIGTDFSDYFTEPDRAREGYQQVFARGSVTDYPLALRHRDGRVADVLYNASVYRGESGEVLGVFAAARDITERKLAEEKLRRSEHGLAEAQRIAHLGNWELDLVHNVLTWSDEIYRIFEIDPDKFGASYEAFLNGIHPDDRDMVNKAYTDSVSSRVPYNIVHRLQMPDGRIKYVNEMCETYYGEDGKPLRSVGTVHDITERKLAEDEVKALNRDLEQRVIERTAQLEAANKELEAFSYSVSHDLRTPLRAIDGFSHILLEDYTDKLDAEGKRLLNVVRDNTDKMGQLIDDILKFSRAGRLELTPVEIDMEKMAHEVFEELQPVVDGSKLQLEIEQLPHASGDRAMMRQVFVNLLSNAIKFSRNQEPARIKVGASLAGDETVYYVKDNGAGFDMQFADKLFGVFQRLHGVTEFEGTGIGLAIVKRIIARHGGRVWAEGKLNEGATMYFALPRMDRSGAEH